jgi:hypothetical protein
MHAEQMEGFVPRREASAIGQGYWRFVGGGESTSKDWVDSISIDITAHLQVWKLLLFIRRFSLQSLTDNVNNWDQQRMPSDIK